MSRYKPNTENRGETINDIYGNELGNFFISISIKNYNAKIEMCGDVSCGVPALFGAMYEIGKKSGFNDKEKLIKIMNKVWEEKDGNKSTDN